MSRDPLERAYRDERAAVLATITRRLDGDLALAEDVVQDAFVAAAVDWDRSGVPQRPGAWLTTTAWRKALDRLRHERVAEAYAPQLVRDGVHDEFDFDESSLDEHLRTRIARLRELMDTSSVPHGSETGAWQAKAKGFSVDERSEVSNLVDELASWFGGTPKR